MTTEISTLDQRIRDRALDELRTDIDAAAMPLERVLQVGYGISIDEVIPSNTNLHVVIDKIKDRIIRELSRSRQEDALKEFLNKVESLETEVRELRDSLE